MARASERRRVTFRLEEDEFEALKYRAEKHDMSVDEYIRYSLERERAFELGELDVPELLTQRVNQVVDAVVSLSRNVENLERVTVDGFSQLTSLTRGDNYLLEDDSGEF